MYHVMLWLAMLDSSGLSSSNFKTRQATSVRMYGNLSLALPAILIGTQSKDLTSSVECRSMLRKAVPGLFKYSCFLSPDVWAISTSKSVPDITVLRSFDRLTGVLDLYHVLELLDIEVNESGEGGGYAQVNINDTMTAAYVTWSKIHFRKYGDDPSEFAYDLFGQRVLPFGR